MTYRSTNNAAGQGLTEVIVITILVAIVVLASVRTFGRSVVCQFSSVGNQLDTVGGSSVDGCPQPEQAPEVTSPAAAPPAPPPLPPKPNPSPPPTAKPIKTATPKPTDPPCPKRGGVCGTVATNWNCMPQYTASCRMPPSAEPANCSKCCSGLHSDGTQMFGFNCGKTAGSVCTCY